jgi:hypothetical protein
MLHEVLDERAGHRAEGPTEVLAALRLLADRL